MAMKKRGSKGYAVCAIFHSSLLGVAVQDRVSNEKIRYLLQTENIVE